MHTLFTYARFFAHEHDDLPAFHAAYFVFAFLTATVFNLGAFGLLIIGHMTLDFVKYRERHGYSLRSTLEGMVRESLVDITLLVVGLLFSVYLHHSVGVASVSGFMYAEIEIIRTGATIVPKLKILHHFLKVIAHMHLYLQVLHPRFHTKWTGVDFLCFAFIGLSLVLIIFGSHFMSTDWSTVWRILSDELIPWRM